MKFFLRLLQLRYRYGVILALWMLGVTSAYYLGINAPNLCYATGSSNVLPPGSVSKPSDASFLKNDSVTIDVSGAVNSPGLYSLELGARVKDALSVAGGVSKYAKPAYVARELNLASVLKDAQKVYIPYRFDSVDVVEGVAAVPVSSVASLKSQPAQTQEAGGTGPININIASNHEICEPPG